MRAALVAAADFNREHFASQAFDCVIAVDAGWTSCVEAGVEPDCAVGDFDSLGFVPDAASVLRFDACKDESDTELALEHARALGADEVLLYGAFGQRIDHSLANMQLMDGFARRGMKLAAVGDGFALVALAASSGACGTSALPDAPFQLLFPAFDPSVLEGPYAPYISVFATGSSAHGVTVEGLAYELSGFSLSPSCSRGLSNRFTGRDVRIALEEGALLVVFPLTALGFARF